MSNDQIIRSTKPHEVIIPEGSNNARSIRNKVGQRDIEQEHQETVSTDKHYTDQIVNAGSDAVTDRHVELEHAADTGLDPILLEREADTEAARIRISESETTAENRVQIEPSQDATERVAIDPDATEAPNRVQLPPSGQEDAYVTLPHEAGRSDNRVRIPSETQADNRALLPDDAWVDQHASLETEAQVDHRATLDSEGLHSSNATTDAQDPSPHRATVHDDQIDSHSHVQEGGTSSEAVKIASDSMHDHFATTPLMTHTESSPAQVDGHGITDPDRVIVESSPDPLGNVPVPHGAAELAVPLPEPEEALLAVVEDLPQPAVSAQALSAPAQVTAHLVDKKAEEFRGRVVKLRDEVDQLNRRLDEFKK